MRAIAATLRIVGVLAALAGVALGLSGTVGLAVEIILCAAGLGLLGAGVALKLRAAEADRAP